MAAAALVFAVSSVLFVWQERRVADPMLAFALWARRPIATANAATLLAGTDCYAGRIAADRENRCVLLGFIHNGPDGEFVGGLREPQPVRWQDGRLARSGA